MLYVIFSSFFLIIGLLLIIANLSENEYSKSKPDSNTSFHASNRESVDKFLENLTNEKIKFQEYRSRIILLKISFIISLFSIWTLKRNDMQYMLILLIIPFVTLCFDALVYSVDASIRNIGNFIKTTDNLIVDKIYIEWEEYISQNRIPKTQAKFVNSLISIIVLLITFLIIIVKSDVLRENIL